jgi:hypothetical protein
LAAAENAMAIASFTPMPPSDPPISELNEEGAVSPRRGIGRIRVTRV